jgi:GNAT superfamily N-acetyltransferase
MEVRRDTGTVPALSVDMIDGEEAERQWAAHLDRAFAPSGGVFLDDFPIWSPAFARNAATLRIGIFDADRVLVATTGVRMSSLRTPGGELPVALVGAVSTDEKHRGMGLATQLVRMASQWAEDRGAVCVFLWGSEHSLYRKLGFELCGGQLRVPLSGLRLPEVSAQVHHHVGWDDSIFELMRRRPRGLALAPGDLNLIRAHRNVEWHWLGEPGRPIAYAAVGRGIDLHGLVHEWGGGMQALNSLLACIRSRHGGAELLGSPELFDAYRVPYAPERLEYLCMARVAAPERILRSLLPDVSCEAQCDPATGQWRVNLAGGEFFAKPEDLAPVLFGPESVSESLPVPLWLWGLDSA